MKSENSDRYLHRRRVLALISLGVVVLVFGAATWFFSRWFLMFKDDPQRFKEFIDGYGWSGRLMALGIQILQVFISLIPGELVEIGIGYTFGAIEGTLLCMAGVALASTLIFLLVKKWGVRLVELFVNREKIDQLRFINSEKKLKRTVFLLFFIPGTPKDLLTYFVGLTRIRLHEFLVLSLIARIPSVVSSTIGGNMIQSQEYGKAILLFVITGVVSLIGLWIYNHFVNHRSSSNPPQ